MKSKIRWYREVLELEPHSKVFFPLARLLVQEDRLQEALETLEQGLTRHPEFVEAKLLQVEVMQRLGRDPECEDLVRSVARSMGEYPAFWTAWARQLAVEEQGSEPALALRFLSAHFSGKNLSWARIIESGLQTLLGDAATAPPPPRKVDESIGAKPFRAVLDLDTETEDDEPETEEEESAPTVWGEALEAEETLTEGEDETEDRARPEAHAVDGEDDGEEGEEETFSLRTRTMADLLAEQGDFEGALDIYRELLAGSQGAARKDLEERVETMRRLAAGESPAADTPPTPRPEAVKPSSPGSGHKKKLMHVLESLAQRLEAKAAN